VTELEPLQIPMLAGRVAIASAALSHSLFATFIVGSALIGAAITTVASLTHRPRYDRLAHMIAFALVLSTGTISFLGVTLVLFLNVFWPRFWHTLFQTMFWPFILEACLFLSEAVFAYAWYYLWSWSAAQDWRRRAHLSFAWIAAGSAVAAMFMIDITASYMLTPDPPDAAWANVLNPTMIDLDLHRWFGNLTWAGFALAALCGLGALRAGGEDIRHYLWAGSLCFTIGYSALLVMPVIGYQYLLHVRYGQPQAFQTLMLGDRSWLFDLVALLYGLLVVVGSLYIRRVVRSNPDRPASFDVFIPISLIVVMSAAATFALPYRLQHLPFLGLLTDRQINPLGKMQPNKYFAIAFLVMFGLANLVYFIRSFRPSPAAVPPRDRRTPALLIALAVCSALIMLAMGWSRETARASNGYLIYGHFRLDDERPTYGMETNRMTTEGDAVK
jgi:cytochrome d ubiquinol oxidase subunit I